MSASTPLDPIQNTHPDPTIALAMQLIAQPSITPLDADCQTIMRHRLEPLGFHCQQLNYGEVTNLWAKRVATPRALTPGLAHETSTPSRPVFVFAGHTDVVPTGPAASWTHPPFAPLIHAGLLYGRGAADMKGSLAAMIVACENFYQKHPEPVADIAFLITSDEEGPAVHGTDRVLKTLEQQGEQITWCLVGEPSSDQQVGDTIKNGRRGSLNATLTIHGKQGHIAYPHLACNPIHQALPTLLALTEKAWDQGSEDFPPTSLQISNIEAGTGATNVIPGTLKLLMNFRFSTAVTAPWLQQETEAILDQHGLNWQIDWQLSGQPFLTNTGELLSAARNSVHQVTGRHASLSTAGGTSDGRFIARTGAQVIELGPCNATIHQINECVAVDDLITLTRIYETILETLLL